ncbi:MAG: HRDC domain-containing protein [Anaerolineae bacterium]|nr:HRDC domain-containing protein [Anaerolineae bacterium]
MKTSTTPSQAAANDLPHPVLIETEDGLSQLWPILNGVHRLGLDTESTSLFAYHERVCLIQISTEETDILLDPLNIPAEALAPLGTVFADGSVQKVLHAAEYDVMCLRRDYGFTFTNLFDTSIAMRVLAWKEIGLGGLLSRLYGVQQSKHHQKADWGRRPLTEAMLRYAQQDTHYLLQLRDYLERELEEAGCTEEAGELFDAVARVAWSDTAFDPEGFWKINGVKDLNHRQQAVLRELYIEREQWAAASNTPTFKAAADAALLVLAQQQPTTISHLGDIEGLSPRFTGRNGQQILRAIQRGMHAPPPAAPPARHSPPDTVLERFDTLHLWRKKKAIERGVSSDVILSRDALWALAWNPPRSHDDLASIASIGPWRRKMYGDEIILLLGGTSGVP